MPHVHSIWCVTETGVFTNPRKFYGRTRNGVLKRFIRNSNDEDADTVADHLAVMSNYTIIGIHYNIVQFDI